MGLKGLPSRLLLALLLCILYGSTFAFIASNIDSTLISQFDDTVISVVQGWEADWLTPIMKTFTFIGSTKVVILLVLIGFAILFFGLRNRLQAFFFLFVMAGTGLLNQSLKFAFQRARPDTNRLIDITGFSFPSGHTMLAFSLYAVSAYIVWRHIQTATSKVVLVTFVIFMFGLIGISRIYLGVHYPSDIVGGIAASAFWVIVATAVYGFIQRRRQRKFGQ